jgi:hypothetical protein
MNKASRDAPEVMVPFTQERRHRLSDVEVPAAIMGFELLLRRLLEERRELELATTAFKAWYWLVNHRTGRPRYPEEPITWDTIAEYLEMVPFSGEG